MKVIWERDDIRPGRVVQKPGCGLSGRHMIGYYRVGLDGPAGVNVYGLVSLADGQFVQMGRSGTRVEVAAALNDAGYYLPAELVP